MENMSPTNTESGHESKHRFNPRNFLPSAVKISPYAKILMASIIVVSLKLLLLVLTGQWIGSVAQLGSDIELLIVAIAATVWLMEGDRRWNHTRFLAWLVVHGSAESR